MFKSLNFELLFSTIERFGFIQARSKPSESFRLIKSSSFGICNIFNSHNSWKYDGQQLWELWSKIDIKKKTNGCEWLSFGIPTASYSLYSIYTWTCVSPAKDLKFSPVQYNGSPHQCICTVDSVSQNLCIEIDPDKDGSDSNHSTVYVYLALFLQ